MNCTNPGANQVGYIDSVEEIETSEYTRIVHGLRAACGAFGVLVFVIEGVHGTQYQAVLPNDLPERDALRIQLESLESVLKQLRADIEKLTAASA
jgi:hypothetical protein